MINQVKANLLERALNVIAPAAAANAYQKRVRGMAGGVTMASGYGNHGASRTKNYALGWPARGGAPEDDIDLHGKLLRARARDLDAGGGLARAATRTMKTSVVGAKLMPKPEIDFVTLGMSEDAAMEWQRLAEREFALWAESVECDATRRKNFYQIQQLAYLSMLLSGDCFALLPLVKGVGKSPYQTRVRLLEADRVCTPQSGGESQTKETESGGRIIDGVEFDKNGALTAYHITNRHPLMESGSQTLEYIRVPAFGAKTGEKTVLHVMTPERPGQARGVPLAAPMMEQLKQLERYSNAELTANIISSYLTLFLTSRTDEKEFPMPDAVTESEKVTSDEDKIELASGAIYKLPPGVKPEFVNTLRANSSYGDYVGALVKQLAASMEIPAEVLLKSFNSNYTASRAALLEFWRLVNVARANFIADFAQPCYEAWLSEAVATGRLLAPGYFDDPMIRKAWCGVEWIGSNMGSIDPLKEVKAAELRVGLNISTEEREAAEMNGSDWEANVVQRAKENAWRSANTAQQPAQPATNTPKDDGSDDNDKDDDGEGK